MKSSPHRRSCEIVPGLIFKKSIRIPTSDKIYVNLLPDRNSLLFNHLMKVLADAKRTRAPRP